MQQTPEPLDETFEPVETAILFCLLRSKELLKLGHLLRKLGQPPFQTSDGLLKKLVSFGRGAGRRTRLEGVRKVHPPLPLQRLARGLFPYARRRPG